MILPIFLFIIGLIIIYFGANWTVNGSSNIALIMGIRPIIVGLTIVSIGTSLPELVVSLVAAINKSKDIALGNIIGSNIANIGLVLGLSAIIRPLKINRSTIKNEIPIMIGFSLLFYFLAFDNQISATDGFILFSGIFLFIGYCIYNARYNKERSEDVIHELVDYIKKKHSMKFELLLIVSGIIGVIVGARIMVDSAVFLARHFGMSDLSIGMTIVAIGTSLPELATSMVAAYQKKDEISVGNVIGSNIFNICMVIGIISIISPFTVGRLILNREFLIMLAFSVLLYPFALHRMTLTRTKGVIFLAGYAGFIWISL